MDVEAARLNLEAVIPTIVHDASLQKSRKLCRRSRISLRNSRLFEAKEPVPKLSLSLSTNQRVSLSQAAKSLLRLQGILRA